MENYGVVGAAAGGTTGTWRSPWTYLSVGTVVEGRVRLCNLVALVQIVRLQKEECGDGQPFILARRKLGVTVRNRTLKILAMYILRVFLFLAFLAQVLVAQQPTPILPDPNLTPGSTFEVTAQDVCTRLELIICMPINSMSGPTTQTKMPTILLKSRSKSSNVRATALDTPL